MGKSSASAALVIRNGRVMSARQGRHLPRVGYCLGTGETIKTELCSVSTVPALKGKTRPPQNRRPLSLKAQASLAELARSGHESESRGSLAVSTAHRRMPERPCGEPVCVGDRPKVFRTVGSPRHQKGRSVCFFDGPLAACNGCCCCWSWLGVSLCALSFLVCVVGAAGTLVLVGLGRRNASRSGAWKPSVGRAELSSAKITKLPLTDRVSEVV